MECWNCGVDVHSDEWELPHLNEIELEKIWLAIREAAEAEVRSEHSEHQIINVVSHVARTHNPEASERRRASFENYAELLARVFLDGVNSAKLVTP